VTPHFSDAELACKCGCGALPPQDAQDKLERTRVRAGFPFPITSGKRCPDHNERESSTGRTGPHTVAAFDIACHGDRALKVIEAARLEGATGIGVKQHGPHAKRFVHIDFLPNADGQPRPTIWSYP
jgi:zinc D-Ala-D-Ala carboxypeptidase